MESQQGQIVIPPPPNKKTVDWATIPLFVFNETKPKLKGTASRVGQLGVS